MSVKIGKTNKTSSDNVITIGSRSKSKKAIKYNVHDTTETETEIETETGTICIDIEQIDITSDIVKLPILNVLSNVPFVSKETKASLKSHYCYILRNNNPSDINRTYNGYTVNPRKRIRQHNQEIKGGAKYTKIWGNKSWEFCAILKGFPDHHNALQCEWRIKHPARKKIRPNRYNSPEGRIMGLHEILQLERWTSQSTINVSELNLELWILSDLAHILTNVPSNIKVMIVDEIDLKML